MGRYSFEALYTPMFWLEYNEELLAKLADKRGTWFGTCRKINLLSNGLMEKSIECLKQNNITTLIVAGGDGSARQCADIAEAFEKAGINIIFALPLTVDGINGGESIGIKEAVKEVVRQTENVVATSLETRDEEKFGVVVVETQGRNRDDIMANSLKYFHNKGRIADISLEDLLIFVIPANVKTDIDEVLKQVRKSEKRTLVFISEGTEQITLFKFVNRIRKRKVRYVIVGHQVQSNNLMSEDDKEYYKQWVNEVTDLIMSNPRGTFSVVNYGGNPNVIKSETIDYYKKLNPKEGQIAKMSDELNNLIKQYMA